MYYCKTNYIYLFLHNQQQNYFVPFFEHSNNKLNSHLVIQVPVISKFIWGGGGTYQIRVCQVLARHRFAADLSNLSGFKRCYITDCD